MAHRDDSSKKSEDDGSLTALAKKEFNYKTKTFPILIRDLSVRKDDSSKTRGRDDDSSNSLRMAPNFASAILGPWLATRLGLGGPSPPPVIRPDSRDENDDYIVSDLNALLLPGQGTLVLGPSSSGKTTLMRTLSDLIADKKRCGIDNVEGTLRVMGMESSSKNRSRTTAYVDQSDMSLTPILTVEETVRFARQCAEGDVDIDLEESMDNVFRLAGLENVKSTIVGDSEIRGISGGQKRRVKLLEMAVGYQEVLFLDEVTNGLDSASALSICTILRLLAETTGLITMTCLLQPSVEALQTFHNLILLTQDGKVAYSGKTEQAVAYFESLGLMKPNKMAVPEFLLRCASSPEEFWDSDEAGGIPSAVSSSLHLAKAFKESPSGLDLIAEIDRVESESKVGPYNDETAGASSLADFATPTHRQIGLLVGRGWKLVVRNPASVMRVVSAIIFGGKSTGQARGICLVTHLLVDSHSLC